jgi:hypothetical protein
MTMTAMRGDQAQGEAWASGTRGVLVGKTFNPNPFPPPVDLLSRALTVPGLPLHKQPKEHFSDRFQRFLNRLGIAVADEDAQLRWRIRDALNSVLASVSPRADPVGARGRKGGPVAISVRHPYHLRAAFDLLPQIPDSLGGERRFLELILSRVLRAYGEQMSAARGVPFSFEAEAREFFIIGLKLERHIKKMDDADERLTALQIVNDSFFHGRNYYYYALLRRERLDAESRMHLWYARASFFLSRIDWRGELLDKANTRMLPPRSMMMFLVRRDRSVMDRYRADAAFRDKTKRLIDSFPKG